jgi:hypothetical protein
MFGQIRRIFAVNGAVAMLRIDLLSEMEDFECATSTYVYTYSNIQTDSFGEEPRFKTYDCIRPYTKKYDELR